MAFQLSYSAVSIAQSDSGKVESKTPSNERQTRTELKQSVTRMTFESGDRRVIQLPSSLEEIELGQGAQKQTNAQASSRLIKPQTPREDKFAVQCNPLGEPEAIGKIPKTYKKYKDRGQDVDVFAPKDSRLNKEKWRRIAELACLEDEI